MTKWNALQKERTTEASLLADLFQEADAIVVEYRCWDVGSRWIHLHWQSIRRRFPDFIEKLSILDMLQASLFHFPSWEEYWAFQKSFYRAQLLGSTCGTIIC